MSDKPFHHLQEDYEGVFALSRKQDAEIERLTALVELGAEKLTGFMGRCAEAEAALRDFYAMADSSPIMKIEAARKHAEALRLAGIKA